MGRDRTKLLVFHLADELVFQVYQATRGFPVEERFGLQSQLRRAAVSTACNIVEGCSRETQKEYLRFMSVSLGSASESRYLAGIAHLLNPIDPASARSLGDRFTELIRGLQKLISALETMEPHA